MVDATTTTATGTAEREAAIAMVGDVPGGARITLGGDKAYDTRDFVAEMRRLGVTPHVSQNTKRRRSAIDGRTTRHAGYAISVQFRKRIEEVFDWIKTVGALRKTRHRGTERVGWMFIFVAAAYNLVRIPSCWLTRRSHARTLSASMIFARQYSRKQRNSALKASHAGRDASHTHSSRDFPQSVKLKAGDRPRRATLSRASCCASDDQL